MRVVAIGNDGVSDADGKPLDALEFVRGLAADDTVLIHDRAASIDLDAAASLLGQLGPDVDVVTGSWTFADPRHGVVTRRGVLTTERLRWSNTVGPVIAVAAGAMQRCGWGDDSRTTLHDLLLRLGEIGGLRVCSVPTVVAHVGDPGESVPELAAAVERHLDRVGISASVRADAGRDRGAEPAVIVDRARPDDLTVSLVVPTTARPDAQGGRLVVNLLDSLYSGTDFPRDRLEVILVAGPEAAPDLDEVISERFGHETVKIVTTAEPFTHSRRTNRGVLEASGDVVVLLNDDTEVVSPGWLRQIATAAAEPGVGLVGPLMRYPDGGIQSAGHAHPHANISEPMAQVAPSQEAAMSRGREVAGVTLACAAILRRRFLAVGGLSARIHNAFNDVDLAMKLSAAGLRHVSLGHVEMVHLETATRAPGVQGFESSVLSDRWASSMVVEHLHFTDEIHQAANT